MKKFCFERQECRHFAFETLISHVQPAYFIFFCTFYRDEDRDGDGGEESPAWDLTVKGPGAVLRLQQEEERKLVQNGEPPMHHEVRNAIIIIIYELYECKRIL